MGRARATPKASRRSRSSRAIPRDSATGPRRSFRGSRAPRPFRRLAHALLEPGQSLRSDAPFRRRAPCEAEPEELALRGRRNRALGPVELQLQPPFEEPFDARHPSFARAPAANVDVAVVGVAREAMTAPLQFLVQNVEHQVRQKRRERAALRGSFVGRPNEPVRQHAAGQKPANELQDALVGNPSCHKPHQDVVVDPVEELLDVEVHHDPAARRNQRLRRAHRLMRGSGRAGTRSSTR